MMNTGKIRAMLRRCDETADATHRAAVGPCAGLSLAAAAMCCFMLGCEGMGVPSFDNMVQSVMPPKPGEVAREAFDLSDPDKRRRSVALLSAAPYGGDAPYLRLYRLLLDDPDATVRAACVRALGIHGEVKDVEIIVPRLTDATQIVRWEAAQALQKIHNPIAIKPLIKALREDEDEDVRMASALALGQYPEPGTFSALVSALDDPDYSVIRGAQISLRTLTGEELGNDGAKWLAWQEAHKQELFANGKPYQWKPFVAPRNIIEKAQFWKDYSPPGPRPPTGLEEDNHTPS